MEEFVRTDQGYVEAKQKLFAFCWSSHLNFFLLQSGQQSFFEITGKLQKKARVKKRTKKHAWLFFFVIVNFIFHS